MRNNMVTQFSERLDRCFAALAHPTRRQILRLLEDGPQAVSTLADHFPHSRPAISRHLSVLEDAGLVRRRKHGRERRCELDPGPLVSADAWIRHYRRFWASRLDALEDYLERTTEER